jgi:hypothetical protein
MLEIGRLAIGIAQRLEVVRPPLAAAPFGVVDALLDDAFLLAQLDDGNREPARLALEQDLGAVLVVAPLELDVVQDDEQVGFRHPVEISEPRQVIRLMDRNEHDRPKGRG